MTPAIALGSGRPAYPMRLYASLFMAVLTLGLVCVVFLIPGVGQGAQVSVDLFALAALLLLLHAVIEGVHWQMAPAYLSLPLLAVAIFLEVSGRNTTAVSVAVLGVLCIVASGVILWALPMFRFEPLTGPYRVGTSILCLIDASREDQSPSGYRELMVQFWYPAAASRNPVAPYRRAAETTKISSYQSVLKTSSRLDAPLADSAAPFPVLLFNPAWNGRRTQNTFLVEELASHGFVVAAIDHTHNSEPIAFPDGRVVMAQHERAMEDVSNSTADEVKRIGNSEVARQVLDARFVLDTLTGWTQRQGSRWHQRLDTNRAGALGHSLGGAVSVECWATDPRVRCAMNMDGWTFGHQASTGRRGSLAEDSQTMPLLFIYEGNYEPFPDAETAAQSGKSEVEKMVDAWDAEHVRELLQRHGGYWLKLQGSDHMNFTDRTISSPLRRLAGGGTIDPRLAHRILRDYAVNFFSQALLGRHSDLLQGNDRHYAEIISRQVERMDAGAEAGSSLP